ncbi:MAG: hypothetical protein K940chlam5_00776 [Candidatus Anoxychlamydiales bacterium]|nr:hypothetical protein [Candidatus Anoxychlamydiales bacterium]
MSVKTITTSATDAGKRIFNGGATAVKWSGRQVGTATGFLRDKAKVVMSFIMGFFKNIPHYASLLGTHASAFAQHIRDNKAYSAGTAGIAVAVAFGALATFKYLTKPAV